MLIGACLDCTSMLADVHLLWLCRERLQEAEAWDARAAALLDPLIADSADEQSAPMEAGDEAVAADSPGGSSHHDAAQAQPAASNADDDAAPADDVADMDTETEPEPQQQQEQQQAQQQAQKPRPDPVPLDQLEV